MKKEISIITLAILTIAFSSFQTPASLAGAGPLQQQHSLMLNLSEDEIHGLEFMREEEKLARDVYTVFYTIYPVPVFNNISQSEQWHMDQVLVLLDKYGIDDPAAGMEPGEFVDSDLQNLYNSLVTYGMNSFIDALSVGALIEEVDILDLEEHIQHTSHNDIRTTYSNLQWASGNHLKAFVRQLSFQGITYEPLLLDMDTYLEIINR